MDSAPLIFLLIIFAVTSVIAVGSLRYRRANAILNAWATRNGFRMIERTRCWFWRGPFFLTTSKSQVVFRVLVEDPSGQSSRGYVRCGGFFAGLFSNQADVRWDPPLPHRPGFPVVFPNQRQS